MNTGTISPRRAVRGTSRRLPRRAIDQIAARRNGRIVAACGCLVIPEVIALLSPVEIQCNIHGWQEAIRTASFREVAGYVLGEPLPEMPAEPQF